MSEIYIKAAKAAITTAKLMKTGQTTSYRTGDDVDLSSGRSSSFTVLAENNPFGNTNRFTDELGGQTFTNNIVIDWSTYDGSKVLGWYRLKRPATGTYTWNQAIDNALSFSIGTFTSGWKLANIMEYMSLVNFANTCANKINYAPFSLVGDYWSSNTDMNTTTSAYYLINSSTLYTYTTGKTSGINALFNRYFTVTGTTLT